ncbi:MAG: S8 family serine peptidase [Actinomycetota bacterium]
MRTTRNPRTAGCRLAAVLLAGAMLVAACGPDDETSDTERNEPADEESEDTEPSATDPIDEPVDDEQLAGPYEWADPTAYGDPPDDALVIDSSGTCSYRPGIIAVFLPPGADREEFATEVNDALPDLGLAADEEFDGAFGAFIFSVSSPVDASVLLRDNGLFASPVYLASPMPARMFFPGSIPVRAPSSAVPARGDLASDDVAELLVVDTGAAEEQNQAGVQEPVQTVVERPWTYGHGAFIEHVVRSVAQPAIAHLRITPSTGPYADETDLAAAILDVPAETGEAAMVVNMSFGVYPCVVDDEPLVPVITAAAFAHKFVADDDPFQVQPNGEAVIVAAAGNRDDAPWTVPAALSNSGSSFGSIDFDSTAIEQLLEGGQTDALEIATELEDLASRLSVLEPRVISVTAPAAIVPSSVFEEGANSSEVPYATTGPWVTTIAEGCHVAAYRGGEIVYPDGLSDAVEAGGPVFWCGTSFAAPVVGACVAAALANGVGPEAVKLTLPAPGAGRLVDSNCEGIADGG